MRFAWLSFGPFRFASGAEFSTMRFYDAAYSLKCCIEHTD